MLFSIENGLIPAYYIEMVTSDVRSQSSDAYAYLVSAVDGDILATIPLIHDATYRVWAHPGTAVPHDSPYGSNQIPHPEPGNPDYEPDGPIPQDDVDVPIALFGVSDPWVSPTADKTVGNNAESYADRGGDDGYDGGVDMYASLSDVAAFIWDHDLDTPPNATDDQISGDIVNQFYVVNFLHDLFYGYGFDEAGRNGQNNNYGRGGFDGDPLLVEAHDFSGYYNANMFTPADGRSPRMQMFLFPGHFQTVVHDGAGHEAGVGVYGPQEPVSGDGQFLSDGAELLDGCESFESFEGDFTGQIAILDFPVECNSEDLVLTAQDFGAVGVIFMDPSSDVPYPFGCGDPDACGLTRHPDVTVPVVVLAQEARDALIAAQGTTSEPFPISIEFTNTFRSSAVDNGVIVHEWGHYLFGRTVGSGWNNQGSALNEGTADTTTLLVTIEESDLAIDGNDTLQGRYPVGHWIGTGAPAHYYGIRRAPYSTSLDVNPLTFVHIANGTPAPEGDIQNYDPDVNSRVHSSGEIWASALLHVYSKLIAEHGFTEGRDRMLAYFVAGLAACPTNPTFTEARDGFLHVAYAADRDDGALMWEGFAERGMGVAAASPERWSQDHAGAVESFELNLPRLAVLGTVVNQAESCDDDGWWDEGETATLDMVIENWGSSDADGWSIRADQRIPNVSFPNGNIVDLDPMAPFQRINASLEAVLAQATDFDTVDMDLVFTKEGFDFPVTVLVRTNIDEVAAASTSDDVELNTAWTTGHDARFQEDSQWGIVPRTLTQHFWHGPAPLYQSDLYLVSPELEVDESGTFSLTFSHRHAFGFEDTGEEVYYLDGGVIEITADGGDTWIDAIGDSGTYPVGAITSLSEAFGWPDSEDNPLANRPAFAAQNVSFPDWDDVTVDFGDTYDGQTVQIRFRIGTDPFPDVDYGWHLDDFDFTGLANTPFGGWVPDDGICLDDPPVADAGDDLTVAEGGDFTIDGSDSFDPREVGLEYAWTQIDGPTTGDVSADQAAFSLTAPEVTTDTTLTYQLVAKTPDGRESAPDHVDVLVLNVNQAPTAHAGEPQTVDEGDAVSLDGTASSDDAVVTAYSWTQTDGPGVTLDDPTSSEPGFIAPEVGAETVLTFTLTVTDGLALSEPASVDVTVNHVNKPPVADAGLDLRALAGDVVTLNGERSGDPDDDGLTYAWTQTSGTDVDLDDDTSVRPVFTVPDLAADEILSFQLIVNDDAVDSPPSTVDVSVTALNHGPTAAAGDDQSVDEGDSVTLDGSGSSDPDDDSVDFSWSQTAGPAAVIDDTRRENPTVTAPEVAADTTLTFQLVVSDGLVSSAADTVDVLVRHVNKAPVADAGDDDHAAGGAVVELDGSDSSDPDDDELTYEWTQVDGPTVDLDDNTLVNPAFTAPVGSTSSTIVFELVVSDDDSASEADRVVIEIDAVNSRPIAHAGDDQAVDEGDSVTLDGSDSSDVDDADTLSYQWSQTGGPTAVIDDSQRVGPTFVAPQVGATTTLTFQLVVGDGKVLSAADTVEVEVRHVNQAPVADAGTDGDAAGGAVVELDGSRSGDPDGDELTYAWTQADGPVVTLDDATSEKPTFTTPSASVASTLIFDLVVNDGAADSSADRVVVEVARVNARPVAAAGDDQTVDEGASVSLDGSASSDGDDDTLVYVWSQSDGPSVVFDNVRSATPSFTAPEVASDTTLRFELVVGDDVSLSTPDTVAVTIRHINQAPVADAGDDLDADGGASVALDGSDSSDPDGDDVTYLWTQTDGTTVTLSDATAALPTFDAPEGAAGETLSFTLVVNDGALDSGADAVSVVVDRVNTAPTADAGDDAAADEGDNVTLDGSGSSDAEGDDLEYAWRQIAGPGATITGGRTDTATVVAPEVDAETELVFELVVFDGALFSVPATVTVTVAHLNRAPMADAGDERSGFPGAELTLNGTRSADPDGDVITYAWTQSDGPEVDITGADTAQPQFIAPPTGDALLLTLTFSLTVSDGSASSDPATVTVIVHSQPEPPVDTSGCSTTGPRSAGFAGWLFFAVAFVVRRRR